MSTPHAHTPGAAAWKKFAVVVEVVVIGADGVWLFRRAKVGRVLVMSIAHIVKADEVWKGGGGLEFLD